MIDLDTALNRFNSIGVDTKADFHTLSYSQVDEICKLAKHAGYRKPKNANGSTARYYFAALVRAYGRWKRE